MNTWQIAIMVAVVAFMLGWRAGVGLLLWAQKKCKHDDVKIEGDGTARCSRCGHILKYGGRVKE